jgi:hypothetical protein
MYYKCVKCHNEGIMVAVQNLKGEIIQLILSRKGRGMYLVSATPPKRLIGFL